MANRQRIQPWWLTDMSESCPACSQSYAYHTEIRCIEVEGGADEVEPGKVVDLVAILKQRPSGEILRMRCQVKLTSLLVQGIRRYMSTAQLE